MISCKRATELLSQQMDQPLTVKEELALKLHLFICEVCKNFGDQLTLFRKALRSARERELEIEVPVPDDAKKRLKERLRARKDGGSSD